MQAEVQGGDELRAGSSAGTAGGSGASRWQWRRAGQPCSPVCTPLSTPRLPPALQRGGSRPAAAGACLPGLPTHLPQHSSVSREIVCCSCAFACCCTRKFCISAEAGFPCAAMLPAGGRGEHSVEDAGGSGGSGGGGGALWALWPNPRTSQQPRSTQSVAAGSARGRQSLEARLLAWSDVTHFPGLVAALVLPWRADDQPRASIVDQ